MNAIRGSTRMLGLAASCLLSALVFSGCASTPAAKAETPKQESENGNEIEDRTFDEAMKRGDLAYRGGDVERALFHYSQAARLDQTADLPLLRIAGIHESRSQPALVRQALEPALSRAPSNAAIHEHLGYALLALNDVDAAAVRFTESVYLDATRWRSVAGLGQVALRRNDLALARRQYDIAMALNPGSAELLASSAELNLRAGKLKAGIRDARGALEKAPSPATQLVLGDLLARSGDFAGGLEAYLVATDEPTAYQRLAEEAMRATDYERALRYFQQAATASPTFNETAAKRMVVARERIAEARMRKLAVAGT